MRSSRASAVKGFLDALERELGAIAATPPGVRAPSPTSRSRSTRPRRTAITVTIVIALGTLPWVAERTERLSPLGTPVASAAAHAGRPGVPPAASYDLGRSRSFPTPDGPGFVVSSNDGRRRCLVVPDRLIPDSFGSSCHAAPKLERDGTLATMVEPRTAHTQGRTLATFLLPRGASPTAWATSRGRAVPVTVAAGVAVAVVHDRAVLHYRVRGQTLSVEIPAPFRDLGKAAVQCRDGRMVRFDVPVPTDRTSAPPPLDTARLCD